MPARSLYRLPPNPGLQLREQASRQAVAHLLRAVLRKPIRSLEVMAALDSIRGDDGPRDLLLEGVRELEAVIKKIETGEGAA
jgi:hypothetical protein